MPALNHHDLLLIYRTSHLVGMGMLVGGAALVAFMAGSSRSDDDGRVGLVALARGYERLFWTILAIQVLTGIGSVGLVGAGVSDLAAPRGAFFALKLGALLLIVLASVYRSGLVAALSDRTGDVISTRARRALFGAYSGTFAGLALVVIFAVRMSRG